MIDIFLMNCCVRTHKNSITLGGSGSVDFYWNEN